MHIAEIATSRETRRPRPRDAARRSSCLPTDRVPPPVSTPALRRSAAAGLHRHGVSASPAGRSFSTSPRQVLMSRPRRMSSRPFASSARSTTSGPSTSATTSPSSRELAHRVLVMYAGRSSRPGRSNRLFTRPGHPYTRRLVEAIPDIAARLALEAIPGHVPPPGRRPDGCVFAPRCADVLPSCRDAEPPARRARAESRRGVLPGVAEVASDATSGSTSSTDAHGSGQREPVLVVRDVNAFHGDQSSAARRLARAQAQASAWRSSASPAPGRRRCRASIMGLHVPRSGEIRLRRRRR